MAKYSDKEKNVKAARQKETLTYKGTPLSPPTPLRLSMNFSAETFHARKEWDDIFKALNGKNLEPVILYPARLSFRIEGEIKSFPDKNK